MTKQERSWILYDWANSAYSIAITSAILPIYYKDVVSKGLESSLTTAYWGYGNSIATLIIAILSPILGTIADHKGYKKRLFRFFFFIGIISTASLVIVNQGDLLKCIIIYILTEIGFSGANIFYDSFLVDITTEENMDWISTSGYAYGYIGSTIPFIISIFFILKPSIIGMNTLSATKLSFLITAAWWLIFTMPLLKNVEQKYYVESNENPIAESFSRLFRTFKNIREHKNIFLFLLAYFFYIDGVSTIIKMAAIYGRDVGVSGNDLLIILLATQFVAFPFALIFGKAAKKFSAKKMIFVGIIIYTSITIYAIFLKTVLQFWILGLLVATAQGGIQALSRSLFGKIVPKDNASEFFGFYDIFGRFAAIMGPFLMGVVTQITGKSTYGVFSLIILFIIGGLTLTQVKDTSVNKNNTIAE